MSKRLYTVVEKLTPETFDEFEGAGSSDQPPADWPRWEEWDEFCIERWGERKPFFMPKSGQIYKSRSAALDRAALINHWGGNAEVLECTPDWQTLEDARKYRASERIIDRIRVKAYELMALEEKLREVSA